MKKEIQILIQQAIKSALEIDFDMAKIKVDYSPEGMGDFSTNVALLLSKEVGKSPMEAAEELADFCRHRMSTELVDIRCLQFNRIEVAKPGFINFWLAEKALQLVVVKINEEKNNFGNSEVGTGKKIHLDFVSANPTGPIHVGNARGGPLGDTLANVFEKNGYEPYREYYVNDAGNQVEILGHSILGDEKAEYSGEYIEEIREKLSLNKNSVLFSKARPFPFPTIRREIPQGRTLKIPQSQAFDAGEEGVKIILEEIIKPSMEKFGIEFDNYFSEKELQESGKVDEVIELLRRGPTPSYTTGQAARLQKNANGSLIYEKDGAIWFKSTRFGDDKDRVVVKSDGQKTYFASDIAYHKEKLDRGFEKLIDIWGADHHGEVARTKGALKALGYEKKLDVILTQFVRVLKDGQEMKMSKRAGTYVSVDDLIDEVGKDATRFFFLMHSADTHMNFDLDLAKERSEKNPVYYIQYAHARIASILRKADFPRLSLGDTPRLSLGLHAKERSLIFELLKFPDLVEEISQNYAVHYLPQYAMGLADKFHSFYDECRVIDEENLELTVARLEIVKAVKIVLAEVLRLMGISAPSRM